MPKCKTALGAVTVLFAFFSHSYFCYYAHRKEWTLAQFAWRVLLFAFARTYFSHQRHSFNQVVTPSFVLTDYGLSESVALWSKENPHMADFGLHAKQ